MTDASSRKPPSRPEAADLDRGVGAYEIKFLLPHEFADQVLDAARLQLPADPHSHPTRGDGYQVNSLYFDTAYRDTYHRTEGYRRRKFRLRRYGTDSQVFLERKSKSKGLVKKRRTIVPECEAGALRDPDPNQQWAGHWYREQLEKRNLAPVCNVTYERVARVGMTPEGPIRFTVDRQIRCRAAARLCTRAVDRGTELLKGRSIVEMKYRIAMPAVFKELLYEFELVPSQVSKFRMSIEACGLAGPTGQVSDASTSNSHAMSACG